MDEWLEAFRILTLLYSYMHAAFALPFGRWFVCRFLNRLVSATRSVLDPSARGPLGLHENFHGLCRLLGRLKTNYQLSELVRTIPLSTRAQGKVSALSTIVIAGQFDLLPAVSNLVNHLNHLNHGPSLISPCT